MEINQQISKEITEVFDQLKGLIQDLTDEQINQKPADGGWSIGQIVEHILRSSSGIPDQKVQTYNRAFDEQVPAIRSLFMDLNSKFEADKSLLPRQESYVKDDLLERIVGRKTKLVLDIKDKDLTLLCMDMEFPKLGYLTRFEWLTVIATHSKRHCYQIEGVRGNFGH